MFVPLGDVIFAYPCAVFFASLQFLAFISRLMDDNAISLLREKSYTESGSEMKLWNLVWNRRTTQNTETKLSEFDMIFWFHGLHKLKQKHHKVSKIFAILLAVAEDIKPLTWSFNCVRPWCAFRGNLVGERCLANAKKHHTQRNVFALWLIASGTPNSCTWLLKNYAARVPVFMSVACFSFNLIGFLHSQA